MKFSITSIVLFGILFFVGSAQAVRRIIVYSSGGNDDAHAFTLLLNADRENIVKIHAVVVSLGDTDLDNACKNIVRLLETAGRLDIPIYRGSYRGLLAEFPTADWFGKDGFGDLNYTNNPNTNIIRPAPADAVNNLVTQYPKQITVLILGSETNAALPLRMFKDYANNLKEFFIMGGKYDFSNKGAAYVPGPEHNFKVDPEATEIIIGNRNMTITLVTEEVCGATTTTYNWRFDVLGKINNPLCNLIKRADWSLWSNVNQSDIWVPWDAFTAYTFLYPQEQTSVQHNLDIDLCDTAIRGQVIVRPGDNTGNVRLIVGFNEDLFRKAMLNACNHVCTKSKCSNRYAENAPPTKLNF